MKLYGTLAISFLVTTIIVFVYQYFWIAPYFDNNVASTFWNGFTNGYLAVTNSILYLFNKWGWVDTNFYFFNHKELSDEYISGFAFGIILISFFINSLNQIEKRLDKR